MVKKSIRNNKPGFSCEMTVDTGILKTIMKILAKLKKPRYDILTPDGLGEGCELITEAVINTKKQI